MYWLYSVIVDNSNKWFENILQLQNRSRIKIDEVTNPVFPPIISSLTFYAIPLLFNPSEEYYYLFS